MQREPFSNLNTLRVTMMKTGPVRDAQQTKLCVYVCMCVQYAMWLWQMLHRQNKQTFRSTHSLTHGAEPFLRSR
jgi:hypothetical protein